MAITVRVYRIVEADLQMIPNFCPSCGSGLDNEEVEIDALESVTVGAVFLGNGGLDFSEAMALMSDGQSICDVRCARCGESVLMPVPDKKEAN